MRPIDSHSLTEDGKALILAHDHGLEFCHLSQYSDMVSESLITPTYCLGGGR